MVSTFPPDKDGIATYTFKLVTALRTAGATIRTATNGREWRRNTLMYIPSIIHKATVTKTRIVHIQFSYFTFGNEYYTGLLPFLLLLLKVTGKKSVITIHDIVPKPNITKDFLKTYTSTRFLEFKKQALYYYTKILCSLADRIIIHSEIAKKALTNDYAVHRKKIRTIPHGVDNFPVNEKNCATPSLLNKNAKIVTYFGLVRKGKGIKDLLKAWKLVENTNTQLLIIGGRHPHLSDDYWENINMMIRELELAKSTCLCGYLPPNLLPAFFANSDAFVFPYNEWGDVIASSGALSKVAPYQKPIIATDVPAFAELKERKAAIIVKRGDITGLASAIKEALTNSQTRTSLITKLNEWLSERSWSKVAAETMAVYRELTYF